MTDFIIALSLMFITAGVLLLVANHFGLSPVPFYIIAGLLTGTVIDQAAIIDLALWGVAFLVFVFGIQVDLGDLQSVLQDGELAAFIQILVVAPLAFAAGYGLGTAFGFEEPARNALYFSAAATLSSTLVGIEMLREELRSNRVYGRLASSIHFFDDIVAVGVLLILSAEVLTDPQLVTSKIGYGVLFLLAGLLIYRHGFPLLVRAADGNDELVLMGSISLLIAFLAAAEAADITIVIGAFAAGLAVRNEGENSLGVRNGIESIKDFFAAIFFVTVGALVSIPTLEVLVLAGVLISLVVVFNPIIHTVAFVFEGYDSRTAFLAGSSLNQVSELSLVIAIQAWLLQTIAEGLFDAIILAAAVTMILSTLANKYEHAFYDAIIEPLFSDRTGYIDEHTDVDSDITNHVVVVGYGRYGKQVVSQLEELGVSYVVVENDPARRTDLQANCRNYVSGDIMSSYPRELARISDARLVISTVDHRQVSESLLETETPAEIILRADTSQEAQELLDSGALFVTVPSVMASDQLVENVQRVLGDESEVASLEAEHRQFLRELGGADFRFGDVSAENGVISGRRDTREQR